MTVPESSAVESLLRSSPVYQHWFRFHLRHSSYVYPNDANVYRELRRLGYINIEADTPESKHRTSGLVVIGSPTRGVPLAE